MEIRQVPHWVLGNLQKGAISSYEFSIKASAKVSEFRAWTQPKIYATGEWIGLKTTENIIPALKKIAEAIAALAVTIFTYAQAVPLYPCILGATLFAVGIVAFICADRADEDSWKRVAWKIVGVAFFVAGTAAIVLGIAAYVV